MKKFTLSLILIAFAIMGFSQQYMTLTFTGIETESGNWLQMDSIYVRNMMNNSDTTLIYPDTVLMLESSAINELNSNGSGFELLQNYPNPFVDKTNFGLKINDQSDVSIEVFDVIGQRVTQFKNHLQRGIHSFTFHGNAQRFYILKVSDGYHTQSLKLLSTGTGTGSGHQIVYNGQQSLPLQYKAAKGKGGFVFEPGDELQIVGFAQGYQQSVLIESPLESTSLTLEFDAYETFSCGDPFTDDRDGKVYPTVQIGKQCWFAENLNIGNRIQGSQDQQDNEQIEKYCYANDENNCNQYGGLYQWDELMQYNTNRFNQGICPEGWHVATVDDWNRLIDEAGGPSVAGEALKAGGNSGFDALLSGNRNQDGSFSGMDESTLFWSSMRKTSSAAYGYGMQATSQGVSYGEQSNANGYAVRCLKGLPIKVSEDVVVVDTTVYTLVSDSAELAQGIYRYQYNSKRNADDIILGDAIVGTEGGGYLRKVNEVNDNPPYLTLETTQATFEDLFEQGDFDFSFNLDGEQDQNVYYSKGIITYLADGVDINIADDGGFNFDFSNTVLYSDDNFLLHITDGSIIFDPEFEFDVKIRWFKLKRLAFYTNDESELTTNINVEFIANSNGYEQEIPVNLASYTHIIAFPVGPVPVIITINLDLNAVSQFNADAEFQIAGGYYNQNEKLNIGVEYEDGNWNEILDSDETKNINPITWEGSVSISQKISLIPEISVKIYDVVGPYFNVDLYEQFLFNMVAPSMDLDANLQIGLNANLGAEATILGYNLGGFELPEPINIFNETIWNMPEELIMISGNNQTGEAGQELPESIRVQVVDNFGYTYKNIPVHFEITEGGGVISEEDVMTDVDGYAETTWTLGPEAGSNKLLAKVLKADGSHINGSPVEFSATATGFSNLPIAEFGADPTTGTEPLTVNFIDQSINNPTSWHWDFGDGNTSNEQNPEHIYQDAGNYTVELTVSNEYGSDTETKTDYINVTSGGSAPDAEFLGSPTSGVFPLTVNFIDQSGNNPTSWHWNFGDGNTSNEQNPEHIYQDAGSYTVSLNVSNEYGSDTETKPDYIQVTSGGNAPVANFTASPTNGSAPLTTYFTDQSTNDPTSWYWDFGDGGTSNDQNPEHTYFVSGNFTVSLTVANDYGSDTETKTNYITITGGSSSIPCPGLETVEHGGQIYNTVLIGEQCWLKENLNIGEMIPGNEDMSNNGVIEKYCYGNETDNCDSYGGLYQWDEMMQYITQQGSQGICPDGWHVPTYDDWIILTTYLSENPEFLCNSNTSYIAKPLASTIYWMNSTYACAVGKNISANNATGFSGLPAGYNDAMNTWGGINEVGNWWSSTEHTITTNAWFRSMHHNLANVDTSEVDKIFGLSVRCLNNNGENPPNAAFSANPTIGTAPLTVNFTDESTNNPTSWQWDFGDGNTSTEQNPEHTYQEIGIFTVELTVTNYYDSDTETKTDYINITSGGEPCPGIETITYGGQVYNTVLIGEQCWLKENLNIGEMIPGVDEMQNNSSIEKYCYDDDHSKCDEYGGLYQWNEMMQYITQQGAKGICPNGWHIPTDEEWKILEGTVDSQYPVGDPEWDELGYRGFDAGKNMKSTYGWSNNGNGTDLYGFEAIPAGIRGSGGVFGGLDSHVYWWSSSEFSGSYAWLRYLYYDYDRSHRNYGGETIGRSVRCIKDISGSTPDAQFSANPSIGTAPLTVNFTDESINSPTSWQWDFGDGNTSTQQNPEHTYQNVGNYTVSLIVSNEYGSDTETKPDYISVTSGGGGEPCPGIETISYGGQVYNTVLIGNQCWLKENLNIGEMISGSQDMTNDGIIQKYCYDNNPANCNTYGGFYQWDEMMQYVTQFGTQGICPDGWHIPTDEEWKILEGTVDSQYQIGDPEWDNTGGRGYDVGLNLKSTSEWYNNGNGTDIFGFNALPIGIRLDVFPYFGDQGFNAIFWTSDEQLVTSTWSRSLEYNENISNRNHVNKNYGLNVRCIKDNMQNPPNAAFSAVPTYGTAPLTVNFTDKTSNYPTSWFWNFGDGNTSIEQNPEHTYQNEGSYTIDLTVSNAFGQDTKTMINYINVMGFNGCEGMIEITYGGQTYNTVEIGNQCWLGENLNFQAGNSWCYDNDPSNCDTYGRLYDWETALIVCPSGWHLPSDEEWKILEGTVDSQYSVGDPEWDDPMYRGYDAGLNLKSIFWWNNNGNGNDLYGFSALPGGFRSDGGGFNGQGYDGWWWSSDIVSTYYMWSRILYGDFDESYRNHLYKGIGVSVRCLKNSPNYPISAFSANSTNGTFPLNIYFTDESTNFPATWQWNFGDGYTSTEQNPEHTYQEAGDYTVSLTVTNSYGSDTEIKTDYIHVTTVTIEPCPGMETIEYGGQIYNTVLIGEQCWLKENMNYESGNSWCYSDDPANCDTYGRLYDWESALNVCPSGWHLPSDEEWKILEGTVDSQYQIGDPEWDETDWRGYDAGMNLKSTIGWYTNMHGTDLYGFTALPGGYRYNGGGFGNGIVAGYWWSSDDYSTNNAWYREFYYYRSDSGRKFISKEFGLSVRCLRD
jgi:uncharacterized protein (TIGR02145 family)